MTKIFDGLTALIFAGTLMFGADALYNVVKREALIRVSKGLHSTYKFTQALTGEHYSWER